MINYGVDAGVSVKGLLIRLAGGGCLVSVRRVLVVVTIVGLVPVPVWRDGCRGHCKCEYSPGVVDCVYNCGASGSTLAWRIGEVDAWRSSLTLDLAIVGVTAIGVGQLCDQLIVVYFWSSLVQ